MEGIMMRIETLSYPTSPHTRYVSTGFDRSISWSPAEFIGLGNNLFTFLYLNRPRVYEAHCQ